MPENTARLAALFLLVMLAAGFDLWQRRIPNWLTAAGVLTGFALNAMYGGLGGAGQAALGLILACAVYGVFFALRAMGGGDVKLMAAIGSLLGPSDWLIVFVFTSLIGAVIAIAFSILRGRFGAMLTGTAHAFRELIRLRQPSQSRAELDVRHAKAATLPHAISIALGSLAYLLIA